MIYCGKRFDEIVSRIFIRIFRRKKGKKIKENKGNIETRYFEIFSNWIMVYRIDMLEEKWLVQLLRYLVYRGRTRISRRCAFLEKGWVYLNRWVVLSQGRVYDMFTYYMHQLYESYIYLVILHGKSWLHGTILWAY